MKMTPHELSLHAINKFVMAMAEIADGGNDKSAPEAKAMREKIYKELDKLTDMLGNALKRGVE